MKATAIAPANIAFIKYWGKKDDVLRLPLNSSISMNLSGATTTTTVEFSKNFKADEVTIIDGNFSEKEELRVIKGLDLIRKSANSSWKAKVATKNTFPKGAGSAASASGFAALTVAGFSAASAADVSLSEKDLTIIARQGSGSACRSIPDGFVIWEKGDSSENSYAHSLFPASHWDLRDILVIVDSSMKKVSTTDGMKGVETSPFLRERLRSIPKRLEEAKKALIEKNMKLLGKVMEEDCLDMHHVMQTQIPPLFYWNDTTKKVMESVVSWREEDGISVYFTIDAGPNVHLICEAIDENRVLEKVKKLQGIESFIINHPSSGAHLINTHLF
ncbi:diphosphomevalonate decarboxylase [Candidatus Gottesmanbacteria bacterium]|nr:diphosphomevalonate decarboxylase [Candidatus Gottesmanbacteria bacterium]